MKLAISYAKDGTITTMFDPAKLKGPTTTLTYVPGEGENHQIFDLPPELEGKPFTELAGLLRVNLSRGTPKLEAK
jgi:hypothetical protein